MSFGTASVDSHGTRCYSPPMDWVMYTKIFVSLLFMVDPVAAIPTYLASTEGETRGERRRTAGTAAFAVACVLVLFTLAGEHILALFSISISSFRVAGGMILMMLAFSMLGGKAGPTKQRPQEAEEAIDKENVGVIPLAIPLMAGPGAMSSIIVYSHQDPSWQHQLVLIGIVAVIAVIAWLCLLSAELIRKGIGQTGMNIMTRIMGILIAAIAVEFVAAGMVGLMPGLGLGS